MCTPTQLDHDSFRILLHRCDGKELLLERNDKRFALPSILVPRCTRVAQQIAETIRKDWKLQACCLFPIGDRAYAVELCGTVSTHPANWLPIHALEKGDFSEAQDFHAIKIATELLNQYRRSQTASPFGTLGWLQDVTGWVEAKVVPLGLHLTGEFQQFNASPTFSLIRFETNGPAIWFKAVGVPNLREYPITIALTKYFSAFVPCVIAMRDDWNAWLSIEAEGSHPDENSAMAVWTTVATTLAEMQLASFGQTLHLVDAGCRDTRVCTLLELVEPFLEAMAELMERQTQESPPALSRIELLTLRTQLQDTLSETDSEIPNAIGHLDFNPGNIVASHDRCVFLDWAEACAGHPFLTFQYLLQHLRRYRQQNNSWVSAVTSAYLNSWWSLVSPKQMTEALRISPLLAVIAYATCGGAWRDPEHRSRPEVARYFRSLTRRVKREMDLLDAQETPGVLSCLK